MVESDTADVLQPERLTAKREEATKLNRWTVWISVWLTKSSILYIQFCWV